MPHQTDAAVVMSPQAFAPFDGLPRLAAVARDSRHRLLWCNEQFARLAGRTQEALNATGLEAVMAPHAAREREALDRPAIDDERPVAYAQLLRGQRCVTRVWPLDPDAFTVRGTFCVLALDNARQATEAPLPLARVPDLGDLAGLTPRELEVFYHLAAGKTVADIGDDMGRSPKTVERHLESLHRKMNFRNRAELVRSAVERGLVLFTPEEWFAFVGRKRQTP